MCAHVSWGDTGARRSPTGLAPSRREATDKGIRVRRSRPSPWRHFGHVETPADGSCFFSALAICLRGICNVEGDSGPRHNLLASSVWRALCEASGEGDPEEEPHALDWGVDSLRRLAAAVVNAGIFPECDTILRQQIEIAAAGGPVPPDVAHAAEIARGGGAVGPDGSLSQVARAAAARSIMGNMWAETLVITALSLVLRLRIIILHTAEYTVGARGGAARRKICTRVSHLGMLPMSSEVVAACVLHLRDVEGEPAHYTACFEKDGGATLFPLGEVPPAVHALASFGSMEERVAPPDSDSEAGEVSSEDDLGLVNDE